MHVHKLLERQLLRLGLNSANPPTNVQQWQEFLERINNTYLENEQDRYLFERVTKIASCERLELLTEKIEYARYIAGLGFWSYDQTVDEVILPKELVDKVANEKSATVTLKLAEIINLLHEEDREYFKKLIEMSFSEEKKFECEVRFLREPNHYTWFYVMGYPRTRGVQKSHHLTGVAMDITKRKKVEQEIENLHKRLLITARQAGMSEVATIVLHNIGNVLNSANVSVELLQESLSRPYYDKLFQTIKIMEKHLEIEKTFLTEDEKGKLIPAYLVLLTAQIQEEYKIISQEVKSLSAHLDHLKKIIAMQGSISGVFSVNEEVQVHEVIDAALHMSILKDIDVEKNYNFNCKISINKSKLIQIMVNLIQNAKDSLELSKNTTKTISITTEQAKKSGYIKILVKDDGVGVAAKELINIFQLGFTTKKKGHGFGLHGSALAAKELGGSLKVKSLGVGMGATFILILPVKSPVARGKNVEP